MLLKGLKVVEMATWVAAPACAMILGEWGAEVIKVESAAGDAIRGFYPDTAESPGNPVFTLENRGKRGIVLDTSSPTGRDALIALLRTADVFVTNVRPGSLARAGLDYASLKTVLPHLIYASVSGYGLEGDGADIAAFDMTAFWNRSGVAGATNPPDQEPVPCRPGFGDHVTALAATAGVLAALHERGRTGRGRLVESSLIRAGVYALGWDMACQLRYGAQQTAQRRDDRLVAISGYYRTSDGRWLFIQARGFGCFAPLLTTLGRPDVAADPRYAPPMTSLEQARELRGVLDAAFAGLTLEEAGDRLTAADLAWAPMASLDEVVGDSLAWEAGCFTDLPDGWGGGFAAPATPIRFPGLEETERRPAPKLGEHTRQILAEAGYGPEAITAMLAAGAAVQGERS